MQRRTNLFHNNTQLINKTKPKTKVTLIINRRPKTRKRLKYQFLRTIENISQNLMRFCQQSETTSNYLKTTQTSLKTYGCNYLTFSNLKIQNPTQYLSILITVFISEKSLNSMSFKRFKRRPRSGLGQIRLVNSWRATLKRLKKQKKKPILLLILMSLSNAKHTQIQI